MSIGLVSILAIGLIIAAILTLRSPFKEAPSYEIKIQVPEYDKLDPDASIQAWISDNLGTINSTLVIMQDSLDKWKSQIRQKHNSYKRGLGILRQNQYDEAIESLNRVFRVRYECICDDDSFLYAFLCGNDRVLCLKTKYYSFEEMVALREKVVSDCFSAVTHVDLRKEVF